MQDIAGIRSRKTGDALLYLQGRNVVRNDDRKNDGLSGLGAATARDTDRRAVAIVSSRLLGAGARLAHDRPRDA